MKKLFIAIICLITLSGSAQSQTFMQDMHWDTLKVSQSGVYLDYNSDSTILLITKFSKFSNPYKHYSRRQYLNELCDYIIYNTNSREYNPLYNSSLSDAYYVEQSYDNSLLNYQRNNELYLVDLRNIIERKIDLPDSLYLRSSSWSPVENKLLLHGYKTSPEYLVDNFDFNPLASFYGPIIYSLDTENSELTLIYSVTSSQSHKLSFIDVLWREDGEAIIVNYDIERSAGFIEHIIQCNLNSEKLDTLYIGDWIDGSIYGQYSTDSALMYSHVNKFLFGLYNPHTGEIKKVWSGQDALENDIIKEAYLSPDRKYVAYYTDINFVIEDISGDSPVLVHKHSTDMKIDCRFASFSPDSKRICYIRSYWRDSTVVDNKPFYYGNVEFVYGTIKEQ